MEIISTMVLPHPNGGCVCIDVKGPRGGLRYYSVDYDRHGKVRSAVLSQPGHEFYPEGKNLPIEILRAADKAWGSRS